MDNTIVLEPYLMGEQKKPRFSAGLFAHPGRFALLPSVQQRGVILSTVKLMTDGLEISSPGRKVLFPKSITI